VQVTCLFTSQFLRLRRTSYQLQHHDICINWVRRCDRLRIWWLKGLNVSCMLKGQEYSG
jgi:hypothetical protein